MILLQLNNCTLSQLSFFYKLNIIPYQHRSCSYIEKYGDTISDPAIPNIFTVNRQTA